MKAPPLRSFAPLSFTARATVVSCSSLSMEQGPAMTLKVPAPTRTSPTATTVSSGWNRRLAALYGSVIRLTSSTASLASSVSISTREVSPIRPITVVCVPSL